MKFLCLVCCLAFSLQAALGQVQPPPTAAVDTVGYVRNLFAGYTNRYYLGTLTRADGTQLPAYLPVGRVGYQDLLYYYLTPPVQGKWGKDYKVKLKKVRSVSVHGQVYETVQHGGKNTGVLARRLLDGPVQLLAYVEPRSLPIPIPLGVGVAVPIVSVPLRDKPHWYLCCNGVYTEMRRAGFAQAMSAFLSDNRELASKVSSDTPGYQFLDTPAIIAEYNRTKASGQ